MNKPKIFIGSSTEGLDIAYAVQENLQNDGEITVWTQGVFQLSTPIITSLLKQLNNFDFAIFVFSMEDMVKMRGTELSTVRDNVIFETGLFAGRLGIERVYFIKPGGQQEMRLPTDLLGVVAGEYDNRIDNNFVAATGVFCNQVRQNIRRLHAIKTEDSSEVDISPDYENDLAMLFSYLEDHGWTTMSFEKIKENVHPKLTEDYLLKLMSIFPKAIRRSKLAGGVYGVKWLTSPK
jgi:hypothetical protein